MASLLELIGGFAIGLALLAVFTFFVVRHAVVDITGLDPAAIAKRRKAIEEKADQALSAVVLAGVIGDAAEGHASNVHAQHMSARRLAASTPEVSQVEGGSEPRDSSRLTLKKLVADCLVRSTHETKAGWGRGGRR